MSVQVWEPVQRSLQPELPREEGARRDLRGPEKASHHGVLFFTRAAVEEVCSCKSFVTLGIRGIYYNSKK